MKEIGYNTADLSRIKYVKVTYTGLDNRQHEITTNVKFIGESMISVYFKDKAEFDIKYPQQISIKFITENGMFVANSVLLEIKKSDDLVFFTIEAPARMVRRQERKYYRIKLNRACVLVVTDQDGHGTSYLSKSIDISAGGILIHDLESMFKDDFVSINPNDYKYFNLVLFLDIDTVMKLSARYIRQEKGEKSYSYAFEYTRMKPKDTDTISKYVTKEQIEQLKLQRKMESNHSASAL